ncbi:MAG: STAS domain-containing protein [Phycisphaeraceae bacterium]|nr:STAS domain-containing protein [Phycisphaeraceae bacterium]MCB9848033.1 STAS domain-containing protein [Phycisphaeraceae bacterium]
MAIDWSDNIVIANLADEPALSDELSTIVESLEQADPKPSVVLDFSQVSYVNSSNIAQVLMLRRTLQEADRSLTLCSVTDHVWSTLMITGLDKVLTFAPDLVTAIAGVQIEDESGPGGPADNGKARG